jgi:hypothetical protein
MSQVNLNREFSSSKQLKFQIRNRIDLQLDFNNLKDYDLYNYKKSIDPINFGLCIVESITKGVIDHYKKSDDNDNEFWINMNKK